MHNVLITLRQRLWHAVPTVLGILLINFFLLQQIPGDAVDILAAEAGGASAESMAALRQAYGLDGNMFQRFYHYLYQLAHLDLGVSPRFNAPVFDLIMDRLGNSLFLVSAGLLLAVLLGVGAGLIMAHYAGRWPDQLLSLINLILYSMPGFWVGLLLLLFFSVQLGWFPTNGHASIGLSLTGWDWWVDRAQHAILPVFTVATFFIAVYARLTRASMLETQNQDYVRTAKAKRLSTLRITLKHQLPNALIPISTMVGVHFAALFGGAAVTETVFGWPGLGRLTLDAVMARDFGLLMNILLLSSLLVVVINIIVDLVQSGLDPRIRAETTP